MPQPFHNEMISAYLDGELNAVERGLVEQKLAESPEHQQVLNEFRALRDSFKHFPSYSLDEKFGERVLRAAERRMLTGNADIEAAAAHISPAATDPNSTSGTGGNRRTWQIAVVSIASVAALLLLTLFLVDRRHPATEVSNVAPRDRHESSNSDEFAGEPEFAKEQSDFTLDDAGADHRVVGESGEAGRRAKMPLAAVEEREEKRATEPAASPAPMQARPRNADTAEFHGGGMGGGAGRLADQPNRSHRAAAGGRKSDAPLTAETTAADMADGRSRADANNYGLGASDYTIVVEVPIEQLSEQPVEVALARSNVRDADKLARAVDSLRKSFAENGQRSTPQAHPPNGPISDRERDRTQGDSGQSQLAARGERRVSELLVVATVAEVQAVCETLNRQGLKTIIGSPSLARRVELTLPGKNMRSQPATASDDSRPADKNEAAEIPRANAPNAEQVVEAESAATELAPAKPVGSAEKDPEAKKQPDGTRPHALRDENAGGVADANENKRSAVRRRADSTRSSLKSAPFAPGAATEADADGMQQPLVEGLEKQKGAEVAGSYFFRIAGARSTNSAEPVEEPAQDAPTSKDEAKKPNDSAGGISSAPTSRAGKGVADQRRSASRLHVRFIIRSTP